ncbi:hypothetical protein R70723_07420 [Paenibacillus sp. FSL R7-0273]|uniref:hypothetical protein n=1 Tax=Paenibacillus sp. FSL R7-0273 TaxID=1536772 RepID=UPI0004F5EEB9|nr:hypothetical protein [Paenibacillus sp. FSL R7-0273]AIQ45735.1 hypothetical protein R70723_07420 [Paenibacillus sp. FSL R7-0273]OMF95257.1 hypothetical protein BK144_06930 [Paenibacillus sp. FSL R7-0273]
MNPYTLDDSLLQQFKQAVFDHDDFLINTYCDFNGENRWNLICSAKDWLSVSVNGLPYINLNHEIDDVRSLNVAQLIMTYDIVVESVKKLLQVFGLDHPLKDESSTFNKPVPDDRYFKQIRACFAAHPVDLDSTDGVKVKVKGSNQKPERYFASWSSDVGGDADYSVYLYSNKPGSDPIPFLMNFAQIHAYTVKRYSLLADIVRAIEEKKEMFSQEQSQRPIRRNANVVEQLQILLQENGVRIREGDGYHYQIKTVIDLFTAPQEFTDQEQEVVAPYLRLLKTLVEEIYQALQTMQYEDLAHGYLLNSGSHRYENIFYDLSKVFEYINNPHYIPSLVDNHLSRLISAGVLPEFVSRETDKCDLQLLLLSKLAVTGEEY